MKCPSEKEMKLEWLQGMEEYGLESDEIVRLFDFSKEESLLLKKAIEYFVIELNNPLDLTRLAYVNALNCNLILQQTDTDYGIEFVEKTGFICGLTKASFQRMVSLIEPFCLRDLSSYQWLYEVDTEIDLLFSPSAKGGW
jgi:hypothetical protein